MASPPSVSYLRAAASSVDAQNRQLIDTCLPKRWPDGLGEKAGKGWGRRRAWRGPGDTGKPIPAPRATTAARVRVLAIQGIGQPHAGETCRANRPGRAFPTRGGACVTRLGRSRPGALTDPCFPCRCARRPPLVEVEVLDAQLATLQYAQSATKSLPLS